MRRTLKLISILLLPILLLCGCNMFFNASAYVQATLDAMYKGDFSKYTQVVDVEETQAHETYEKGYKEQADLFAKRYGIKSYSESMRTQVEGLYQFLYSCASYQVGEAKGVDGGYAVEVTVNPITIFQDDAQKINDYVSQFNTNNLSGTYLSLSEQDFEDTYTQGILDILSVDKDSLHYGDPQTITLHVCKNEEANTYYIDEENLQTLQTTVLPYE